jgi:hypothetical protein
MKKMNILLYLVLIAGAYWFFVSSRETDSVIRERVAPEISLKEENIPPKRAADYKQEPPKEVPYHDLPEDIRKASEIPESNNPDDLPPDLKAQLNAPPPELPEDLRKQLEMGNRNYLRI